MVNKLIESMIDGDEKVKETCKDVLVEVIAKFQTFSSGDELKDEIIGSEKLLKVFEIKVSYMSDKLG